LNQLSTATANCDWLLIPSVWQTLGISSQSQFAVAVDNWFNSAVIADQNNNRVLLLALPK